MTMSLAPEYIFGAKKGQKCTLFFFLCK